MAGETLVLLTTDDQLAQALQGVLVAAAVQVVTCLREIRRVGRLRRLFIDPRSVGGSCCLGRLARWKRQLQPSQVVLLALPAAPETLLRLPLAFPGVIAGVDQVPYLAGQGVARTSWSSSWVQRGSILSPFGKTPCARRFLALANAHDHEGYTVAAAAAANHLSVRQLRRLSQASFRHPPAIVIALARIASVARDIIRRDATLERLADEHGFGEASTMSRQFTRFVGVRPGAYRRRSRRAPGRGGHQRGRPCH